MTALFSESAVETAALARRESIGWRIAHGPDIALGTPQAERADYGQLVLERRLREDKRRTSGAPSGS